MGWETQSLRFLVLGAVTFYSRFTIIYYLQVIIQNDQYLAERDQEKNCSTVCSILVKFVTGLPRLLLCIFVSFQKHRGFMPPFADTATDVEWQHVIPQVHEMEKKSFEFKFSILLHQLCKQISSPLLDPSSYVLLLLLIVNYINMEHSNSSALFSISTTTVVQAEAMTCMIDVIASQQELFGAQYIGPSLLAVNV